MRKTKVADESPVYVEPDLGSGLHRRTEPPPAVAK
jgi:hypothetical protein